MSMSRGRRMWSAERRRKAKDALHAMASMVGLRILRSPDGLGGYKLARYDEFRWLRELDILTVLDIGANVGQFARFAREIFPAAAIYSFEPLPDSYRELVENAKRLGNCRAFNVALGDENGEALINESAFSPSSSFLKMLDSHRKIYPHTTRIRSQGVQMRRLDDMTDELSLREDILVKLDVQGYEGKVIAGGRKVIGGSRIVIVETSFLELYEGEPLFRGISNLLDGMGFDFAGLLEQSRAPDGRPLQADAVFLKRAELGERSLTL